jgi:hypothetical protein
MALTVQQIKLVEDTLVKAYKNVSYDGKKNMIVFVDNADRTYRKNELQKIQKLFSKAPFSAKYTVPTSGGKTGAVKMSPLEISVKASLESKPISTGKAKFKPSDIIPSIVNEWLNPEEMTTNVIKYIKSVDLEKKIEDEIIHLLNKTAKDTSTSIRFDSPKNLVPPEFFEVLTAIKLAVLLRANDVGIRKTLGIPPKMDLSKSKIKIYIPQKANFPLIDYYINITAAEKKDEESSLKISVKSKVKSPKANTVKFKDIFQKEKEVNIWYKGLNAQLKREQVGPRTVAESALEVYGSYSGKALSGIPLKSVINLLKSDRQNISKVITSQIGTDVSIAQFEKIINKVFDNIRKLNTKSELSEVLSDKELLDATLLIQTNMTKVGGTKVDNSVYNLAYLCEKIMVTSSKENSVTKYNYYQMFFDEVLTKKKIAYAVASLSGTYIKYNFYSMVNFKQEYASWLALRSKNSPNSPNDVIGIDV